MLNLLRRLTNRVSAAMPNVRPRKPIGLKDLEQIIPEGTLAGDGLRAVNQVENGLASVKSGTPGISQEQILEIIQEYDNIPRNRKNGLDFHVAQMKIVLKNEGVDLATWDSFQYSDNARTLAFKKANLLIQQALVASCKINQESLPKETVN